MATRLTRTSDLNNITGSPRSQRPPILPPEGRPGQRFVTAWATLQLPDALEEVTSA